MQYNDLLVYEPGNQYPNPSQTAPFTSLPSWWRGFIFKILNPREFAIYMYIAMKADGAHAVAFPLASEIQAAMNLASDSSVFAALRTLEVCGFIRRRVRGLPNRSSLRQRNIYQRAALEFTLLELLKRTDPDAGGNKKGVNEFLTFCIGPFTPAEPTKLSPIPADVAPGLKRLLADHYDEYALTQDQYKREALRNLLQERLDERLKQGGERYQDLRPAPRDVQRQKAREREKAIAASGGVAPTAVADAFATDPFGDDDDDEVPF